jgi:hypothetical protein
MQQEGDRGLMGALAGGVAGNFLGKKLGHNKIGALVGSFVGSKFEDKHKYGKHGGKYGHGHRGIDGEEEPYTGDQNYGAPQQPMPGQAQHPQQYGGQQQY